MPIKSLTRRVATITAPLALLTLGACATPFQANVQRFQQMPPAQGQSFTVTAPDPEMARSLEDIAAQVAQVARKTEGKGVLYGGGVTPDNGGAIWTLKGVSGILLGQGSLDAEKFAALVNRLPV